MLRKFKSWLCNHFLPMWAKETVLADNKNLQAENRRLKEELSQKEAYINGLMAGIKSQRRIVINTTEGTK